MSEFIETEEASVKCTFALGKTLPMQQPIYICCCQEGNQCCCAGCASICHEGDGHDVTFLAFGDAYCDCGHSGCALSLNSKEAAASILVDCQAEELTYSSVTSNLNGVDKTGSYSLKGVDDLMAFLEKNCIGLSQHSKNTFWMNALDEPRCALEALAKTILSFHSDKCSEAIDTMRSGVEWWVQVKDVSRPDDPDSEECGAPPPTKGLHESDPFRGPAAQGIDLHYDKDEVVAAEFEVGLFPTISTVTYLSSSPEALPTLVFDCRASDPVGGPIRKYFQSNPCVGKHIAFDGKLLHGAPDIGEESKVQEHLVVAPSSGLGTKRVTFLANIWVNHHPARVQPLPSDIMDQLQLMEAGWRNEEESTSASDASDERVGGATCSARGSEEVMRRIRGATLTPQRIYELCVGPGDMGRQRQSGDRGEWLAVPFVSDKAAWGKGEGETGIGLHFWRPSIVSYLSDIFSGATNKGKGKGKGKSVAGGGGGADFGKMAHGQSFIVSYKNDKCAARLEYDEDDDDDDDDDDGDPANNEDDVGGTTQQQGH